MLYDIEVQWYIGVDEAGRGALAGPISVGAVLYPSDFDWREAFKLVTRRGEPKLRDSKQLSAQQREILFEYIATSGRLRHAHAFVSADSIDTIGIVNAAHEAVAIAISTLQITPDRAKVVLDAGLKAPSQWNQESFVRGDEQYPAISFASIVAKVARDRFMEDMALKIGGYGFEQHKGYGVAAHYRALRLLGPSLIHRKTFLMDVQP